MDLAANFPPGYTARMREAGYWRGRLALDDFDAAVRQWPDHPAVIDTNSVTGRRTALTYRVLNDRAGRIAHGLLRLGVRRGDVVSFQMPTGGRSRRCTWPACASAP